MKFKSDSVASALAIIVLEHPGGPYSKWPRGGRQPSRENSSGWRIGHTILCSSLNFNSTTPPISDQCTCKPQTWRLEDHQQLKATSTHCYCVSTNKVTHSTIHTVLSSNNTERSLLQMSHHKDKKSAGIPDILFWLIRSQIPLSHWWVKW